MREKIVLIGAGSAMFTRGLLLDLLRRGWDCDLALVDTNPEALAVAEGLCRKMLAAKQAPVTLTTSTDRRQVLSDATVVITTIGVGGRPAWEQDVLIPRKYGIFQPVGDSVMPGGTSRCLRMIPAMVGIAKDVLDFAPDALFINYANPMSAICRAVRKATGAEIVGLCIGVCWIASQIAKWFSLDPSSLRYSAIGINHLTWFVEVQANGEDLLPRMREYAERQLATSDVDSITDPFCLHLLRLFGAYPAPGDRHVSEFFPEFFPHGSHFGKTLGVDRFSFEGTISTGDAAYAEMKELAFAPGAADHLFAEAGGEHSQALEIIDSVRQGAGRTYSASLPNQGQVPNLPLGSVVEAPAIATAQGLKPIAQRPLLPAIAGTLARRFAWVETVVEAALEGSREKFIQALILDGAVGDVDTAERMADELLAAQAEYLPQFAR